MGIVIEAYDGRKWGWDSVIQIHEGTLDSWVWSGESIHIENSREALREILPFLSYKIGGESSDLTSLYIELPHAHSVKRVLQEIEKALKNVDCE